MRRLLALVLAMTAMLAATIAAAEPETQSSERQPVFAISSNPVSWAVGTGTGTAGLRLTAHLAMRANVASYSPREDYVYSSGGRTTDVSTGCEYFPRALWDGFSIVAEVMYRRRDTFVVGGYGSDHRRLEIDTHMLAARAHVAWTWRLENLLFSTGLGISTGRELGTHRVLDRDMDLQSTLPIEKAATQAEWFARVGWVFGR